MMRLVRVWAAATIAAACFSGCLGDIGNGDGDGKKTLPPGAEPSVSPLMKLSTVQYNNTVIDLLSASGLADVVPLVEPFLGSVPADSSDTFRGLDNRIATEHMNGYFNVATAVGDAVESDVSLLTAVAGACATEATLSSSCADDFLATFGRRVFRRSLSDDETARYSELNDGVRPPAEAIRAMLVTLLLSPNFLNHLELDGTAFQGRDDVYELTGWELASKLSYTFWQTMPDDELLSAAADGSLDSGEGYAAQVERVFADPRTAATIWTFWNEWFRLDRFAGFQSTRPGFQTLAAGENVGEPGHDHYADMVQEINDLTALFTWDQDGTLIDLLTTNLSVTPSADLASLYGVEPYSSGAYPTLPDGERTGILQRAALLANPLEQTNPFHRGAFVRRYILCDPLPQPDPTSLPPGSLDPPPPSDSSTTRERFEQKVADNPLCETCHGSFSDIGYVLEAFDALGRYRDMEVVIDEQTGNVLNTLPIDTTAVAEIEIGDTDPVQGPSDLNERIIDSGKFGRCLSEQYFTYVLRREPGNESGDVAVGEELASPDLTLSDIFKQIALHPSFQVRKVGSQ